MVKSICAIVALAALSGCVAQTVRGIRERAPVLVAGSRRSVADLSLCISDAWIAKGMTPKSLFKQGGASVLVDAGGSSMPLLLVDLDNVATGTRVTMWQFKSMWSRQNQARLDEVSTCLAGSSASATASGAGA